MRVITATGKLIEFQGPSDITVESTDAIVNAANSSLLGGGGVDGAIHDAGGPAILEECKRYVAENGRLPAGSAMITVGGCLPAKHVIHTVGPVYRGGDNRESEILASCYRECMRVAEKNQIASISFPAISTGAYGYPILEAAQIAVSTVLDTLEHSFHVKHVKFVLFDIDAVRKYTRCADRLIGTRAGYRIMDSDESG